MKIKSLGFTLIELLAVIVILAIILLIATPIILNIIDDVRQGAFKSSAGLLLKTTEQEQLLVQMNNNNKDIVIEYTDGEMTSSDKIEHRGENPRDGVIIAKKDGSSAIALHNGTYCAYKISEENEIKLEKINKEDCLEKIDVVEVVIPGFDSVKGVNKPVLSSGMTPIVYNGTEWVETTENDTNWYNYNETDKKWANVKTEDGSYWVWIPRYAYQITSGFHSSTTGTIDVKFLKGTTNEAVDNTIVETSGYEVGVKDTSTNFFKHPAFTFGSEEVEGFWVAKFEASAKEGLATITGTCNSADNVSTKTVQSLPSLASSKVVNSWRCVNIKNAFEASRNMENNTSTYGWTSNEVDTHMMKNSEWGAVAYLSKSSYGKVTEIWNNSNNQYKTGCAGSNVDAAGETLCNEYNSELGINASTTGNIYGIYDMSGGAWERVAANYNNLVASSGFTQEELINLESKYIDRYTTLPENMLNGVGMDYDTKIFGDGVFETSNGAYRNNGSVWVGNGQGSWNTDYSYLPHSTGPWLDRGGYQMHSSIIGLFAFSNTSGGIGTGSGFRTVVIVGAN